MGLIGDNGETLDLPGRALSHAVVAASVKKSVAVTGKR
ncbi:hypothetical protein [Raoultella terrigena]